MTIANGRGLVAMIVQADGPPIDPSVLRDASFAAAAEGPWVPYVDVAGTQVTFYDDPQARRQLTRIALRFMRAVGAASCHVGPVLRVPRGVFRPATPEEARACREARSQP